MPGRRSSKVLHYRTKGHSHYSRVDLKVHLHFRIFVRNTAQWQRTLWPPLLAFCSMQRNAGPFIQRSELRRASADNPQERSSAGFRSPLTCLYWSRSEPSRMIAIRLATNVWNRLVSFLMKRTIDVLSIQKTDCSANGKSSSLFRTLSSCTEATAAESSKRGIVICLRGTRRDFPWRIVQ